MDPFMPFMPHVCLCHPKKAFLFLEYVLNKSRILVTPIQMFCDSLLYFLVIFQIIIGPDCVLTGISKMPVQNSNSKISAHPDLGCQLLQSLNPTRVNSRYCVKKGNFYFKQVLEGSLFEKRFDYYPKEGQN